ncbi:Zf-FLZ domain containing protein [Parasponia andersonii]|uniref:Zf-FLZ domain containing protein n=1 Tax=Parasponia andersonii TaxID=3476 RepID=A0A2P5CWB7_PARAD|nr:Zf-FLZ domain containing protein [Parasponia andersonii]
MLLGKRPRPPIKRTTSMSGITTVDPASGEAPEPTDLKNPITNNNHPGSSGPSFIQSQSHHMAQNNFGAKEYQESFLAMLSPRNQRRNSADFIETAHFLRTCGLCKRRLASGRDIYMYMGDTAFCSLECREQQMKQDERKEKKCVVANDERRETAVSGKSSKASSSSAGKSQTVAAA